MILIIRYVIIYTLLLVLISNAFKFFHDDEMVLGAVCLILSLSVSGYEYYRQVIAPMRMYWQSFVDALEFMGFYDEEPGSFKELIKQTLSDFDIFNGDSPQIGRVWFNNYDDVLVIAGRYIMGSNLYRGIYVLVRQPSILPKATYLHEGSAPGKTFEDMLYIKGKSGPDLIRSLPSPVRELWARLPFIDIRTGGHTIAVSFNLRKARKLEEPSQNTMVPETIELLLMLCEHLEMMEKKAPYMAIG